MTLIGSLNEGPLHAALKRWYYEDGDRLEVPVEEFVVDLVRDGLLIEIQTRGFSAMRRKFDRLLDSHPMLLVHPIPATRWIVKLDENGRTVSRRRSPKRGIAADVCAELVTRGVDCRKSFGVLASIVECGGDIPGPAKFFLSFCS